MKILGLGNALADILIQVPDDNLIHQLHLPKGSMQLIPSTDIPEINKVIKNLPVVIVSGGSAANTIHGIACMGLDCGYIGKVGHDEFGEFYENDLAKAGVQSKLLYSQSNTGMAYTFITPDGERTFATFLGAAVELLPEDISQDLFIGYDLLHLEGYLVNNRFLVEKALQIAKNAHLKISLDLSSYNVVEANLDFLKRIIPDYVDIVFANEEESKAYSGKDPLKALDEIANHCEIAIVKIGKDGALIKSAHQITKIAAFHANVIDTTGAGDQFAAGFLYGLAQNLDLEQCGKLGALLASHVIENYGARIKDEQWKVILQKMNNIASID